MNLQARMASKGGDTWRSWSMLALWPYPAVLVGSHHSLINADDYRCFTRLLQPGDLILTRSEPYFISNYFIGRNGTAFSHLAVYTGSVRGYRDPSSGFIIKPKLMTSYKDQPGAFKRTVTHAISDGVVCQDLLELMMHSDWVAAVRPSLTVGQGEQISKMALSQVGKEYNFDFKPEGPPALYCTELGCYCLKKVCLTQPEKVKVNTSLAGLFLPMDRFKSQVTIADSFIKFPMVCCTLSCNNPKFARQSRYREWMRRVLLESPDSNAYRGSDENLTD